MCIILQTYDAKFYLISNHNHNIWMTLETWVEEISQYVLLENIINNMQPHDVIKMQIPTSVCYST